MRHIESILWTLLILAVNMMLPSSVWAEGGHQLTVKAKPAMAGTFNKNAAELVAGQSIQLVAYANANFTFLRWTDAKGNVVSQQRDFTYVMPAHDATLTAEYEYNPANPANPARNYWNAMLGEVIVDDFTTGALQNAVKDAIGSSKAADVMMITVAGVMNSNDFGIVNTYQACTLLDLSRVTGITQVPSYAFDYTYLESVYLPATIEKIGQHAFYSCQQLASLIVYAMTPPTLESNVFTGVPEGLVVYVPAAAIAQYQEADGWKGFTILPIQEDIRSISVSLPEGTSAADYAQMWLELTNTKSGQRMHYVMTDRTQYTFANIIRNTTWNVTLRNERGDVFGRIDDVEVKDEDVMVAFATLSKPQTVSLVVKTPDGQDVTAQTQITWTDVQGGYVAQGASLAGLPAGYEANYRVVLSQELAMQYDTPQAAEHVLKDGGNDIVCQLQPIKQIQISGKVKDAATGLPLSGAVISASQTFGGKYSKTLNAKTDGNGVFTLDIANVPTSVAFAASDYVSQTLDFINNEFYELNKFIVPDISLKTISGVTITLNFSYTTCDGETQNWYSDYQNVNYELFNFTKNKTVSQYNVQYPQIVLLEDVEDGDVLRLTATSRTNAFMPVLATATITEQKAEATFDIVELGQIQATFTTTGNAAVVGSLYDAAGKLQKTYDYTNASLTISNLADGQYTLVSMGSSRLFNTIYDLAQLPQTGLVDGTDYVQHSVEVKSGQVTAINISEVPTLNESKLYYTGDNTSFTVNKPSIVAGNYLTLTGRLDFKSAYAASVSNVQMIVDLPESCEFVENSVMVGNSTSSYTLNGNRITIPMTRYTDRVRFCIIPTLGGEFAPSAFVQFDLDGETVTQPIGSANYTAKDLSISVPSTVAKTAIPVSGTAIGTSSVEIYDNGVLIGQTTSLANGTWATTCELNEPYNLSTHSIYAKVNTKDGLELRSETMSCLYDKNGIEVKTVTMINTAHRSTLQPSEFVTVFDFQNNTTSAKSYNYWPSYPDFTFIVDLTNNDSTMVSDVMLHVFTDNNEVVHLNTKYDGSQDRWVATRKFYQNSLPVNLSVSFNSKTVYAIDSVEVNRVKDELDALSEEGYISEEEIDKTYEDLRKLLADDDFQQEQLDSLINILRIYYRWKLPAMTSVFGYREGDDNYNYNPDNDPNVRFVENTTSIDELNSFFELHSIDLNELKEAYDALKVSRGDYTQNIPSQKYENVYTPAYDININSVNDIVDDRNGDVLYIPDCNWHIDENYFDANPNGVRFVNDLGDSYTVDFTKQIEHLGIADDPLKWERLATSYSEGLPKVILDNMSYFGAIGSLVMEYDKLAYYCVTGFASATTREQRAFYLNLLNSLIERKDYRFRLDKAQWAKHLQSARNFSVGVSVTTGLISTGYDLWKANNAVSEWNKIIDKIGELCDAGTRQEIQTLAKKKKYWTVDRKNWKCVGSMATSIVGITSALSSTITFGTSLAITAGCVAVNSGLDYWERQIDITDKNNKIDIYRMVNERCKPFPIDEFPDAILAYISPIHDPSGYVYEGVASNRLEGVTATAYYKETVEDMYGDLHENIVKWDAEEYAQENPLFTDEAGMYAWDVPQGLWQVKFEKEGYETAYSEWLPVPPPQLDVNIAMKQNRQPEVKMARAYEDAVEVEFDKYMMPELLTEENISVMQNGTAVEGTIELLNAETASEGSNESFASKVRFNAAEPFTEQEVTLMVSNRVKSYAGIRMQDDYQQTFSIEQEIRQIQSDSVVTVGYGSASTLTVAVLPASASKGKTLTVKTSSPMILDVETEQVTIAGDGKAEIIVTGELPGTAALTFAVEGTDKTAMTIANVEQISIKTVAMPKASIASGTVVEKGTAITLTCGTEGATIYYTLDGSCPCIDTDARKVYDGTPIIINETVTIKAMAMAPDMYESEVAKFTYLVEGTGINDVTANGQIQIYPLPVRDKVNISAGGKIINSVTISSLNGVAMTSTNKYTTMVTLDVCRISTGIYIINVTTMDGTFSHKILKVE